MLNRVVLMGRIANEIELKVTASGVSVLSFNVAVERSFSREGEEKQTDFITCVAWRNQADFISKYFSKGRMIALEGSLRTRTYDDKNGTKHYVTEVYVDSVSFTGEKTSDVQAVPVVQKVTAEMVKDYPRQIKPEVAIDVEGFEELGDGSDLPF